VWRASSSFAQRCMERIAATFRAAGRNAPEFLPDSSIDVPYFRARFEHLGKTHTLEVCRDQVTMHAGPLLFECYMKAEWSSEDAYITGFATRLSRYLGGGKWEGQNERLSDQIRTTLRHWNKTLRRK
jgi:hypothetical protein